jgi:hypothetical protein
MIARLWLQEGYLEENRDYSEVNSFVDRTGEQDLFGFRLHVVATADRTIATPLVSF